MFRENKHKSPCDQSSDSAPLIALRAVSRLHDAGAIRPQSRGSKNEASRGHGTLGLRRGVGGTHQTALNAARRQRSPIQ